jgi:hypothetical protein
MIINSNEMGFPQDTNNHLVDKPDSNIISWDNTERFIEICKENLLECKREKSVCYDDSNHTYLLPFLYSPKLFQIFITQWGGDDDEINRGFASYLSWSSHLYDTKGDLKLIEDPSNTSMKDAIIDKLLTCPKLVRLIIEEDTRYFIWIYQNKDSIPPLVSSGVDARCLRDILLAMKRRIELTDFPCSTDIVLTLAAAFDNIDLVFQWKTNSSTKVSLDFINKILPDADYYEFSLDKYCYVLNSEAKKENRPVDSRLQWRLVPDFKKYQPLEAFHKRFDRIKEVISHLEKIRDEILNNHGESEVVPSVNRSNNNNCK